MYVALDNADDIETILKSPHCLNKDDVYHYVKECLGVDGLFTAEGKLHHHGSVSDCGLNMNIYISIILFVSCPQRLCGSDIENW